MKRIKIVVIGAGSSSFGLTNLGAILRTPELKGSELCLIDINLNGLNLITKLAERINKEWNSGFTIKSSNNRREFLPDADFVIISVAVDREKCWKMDHEIAQKYHIMHYAENSGPGGMMHTFRNTAIIMPIIRDIESLCPDAYVMNFTNPVPRICILAARHSNIKMVGICHQINFGYLITGKVLAKDLGIEDQDDYLFRWNNLSYKQYDKIVSSAKEKIDILAAGINHFTWMLSIVNRKDGTNLYPLFKERYMNGYENFEPLTRELLGIFDICPVPGDCHMVEYLPYTHNMNKNAWEGYDIQMYPLDASAQMRNSGWENIEAMAEGKKPVDHLREVHTERAELIMAAIVKDSNSYEAAVNLKNHGYIKNLPEESIVEVPAIVNAHGINGIGVGCIPEPAAELCRRQITLAELVIEAAVKGDRKLALQALLLDPMIDDVENAKKMLLDYLNAEQEYLPQFFGKLTF